MQNKFVLSLAAGLLFFTGEAVVNAQPYSNAVAGLNPVGYWPLNETTQPPQPLNLTANNLGTLGAAGNGNYGAWYQPSGNTWFITNNTVLTTGATVDGDTAMNCQFAPGQYIVLPRNTNGVPNSALTLVPPFSIEAWVNPGATNARLGGIVSEGQVQLNSGGQNTNNPFYGGSGGTVWAGFALGQYQNYFFFSCYNTNAFNNKSSELDSPKTLIIGQWVHLVVTFDGTHEIMYENGVQVAQKTLVPNAAGLTYVPDPTSPLMIGSGSDVAVDYGVAWTGALDEVAIYNTLLPPSSMQNHYQTAFGTNATYGSNYTNAVLADSPMIYFRMDDAPAATNAGYASGTFPVANNYGSTGASGNGVYQPGTVPGLAGPSYSGFGANSKSVALNGWFGAVDVGSSNIPAALNPTGKAPLTVVTWFKTAPADAPGRFQEILGHSDSSYRLALGQVAGENHFNPGPSPAELQFTAASDLATNGFAFNDGQWHMVAGVSDGTNEYMYLDGTLAKSSNFPAGISITGTTRDLLLGGDPQYTAANANTPNTIRNFDGQIAQAAFWTNALSAGQIQSLFTAAGVPPYIWQEPVSVTTNAGVNLTVASGVRGSAPVSYQWYQNGSALSSQTSANLAYTPITTNNAGTYYLIASNSYGSITSSVVTLVVYGVPTILQQSPTQMEIFAGISPTLKATVAGEMPLSFQWSSNGVAIASGTTSAYTVANAQAGATYTCTITNVLGTNSINPISMSIVPAPTAPFPASVLADGPISYFRMDETSGTTCYDYVGGENGTYTNVSLGVPGYDSLNNVKTDSGETAAEFGDFPPNNDYAGNFPTYVNFGTPTGGNAEFSVEAWVTQYFYETNGDCIAGVGYGNGGEQFVLDTGNTGSGALRFFVRNAAGTVSAANATNLLSNDGKWHHVVGVCDEAGGHVYLYLDGAQVANAGITAGSGLQASSMPLSIGARESNNNNPVSYDAQFIGAIDDVAIYNKALSGTQIQSHYYATGFGPVITQLQPTNNLTTNQGSSVTFTVSVRGTAPLSYQWNDPHGNPLSGQTTATLTLANVQTNQSGNYTVTVTNLYGTAGTNTMLNVVIGAPLIVQDITPSNVTAYATDPVTLSVGVAGSQPLYYQWYQDGGAVFGATNSSFTFGALVGTNTYYCSITNSYSKGPTNSSIGTVVGVPITTLNPSNYTSNLKITFNGYNRGETLFDFPVLVRLSDSLPGFSYGQFASPAGGDLRFTDSTGTRELPYEIDEWNDTNGVSSVWVQVRQLSGTNDSIWAYWGNPSDVTPPAYTTNGSVWVPPSFEDLPSYDIVYHLKGTNFPYADSTQVYPALTGVAPAEAPGIVGSAEAFDGATTFLDSGVVSDLGSAFTLSAWVNVANTASSCQTIWANQKGGFGSAGFSFFVNFYQTANEQLLLDTGDGTNGKETSTAAGLVTFGQWHMVTAAIDATDRTVAFSVDGQPAGGGAVSNFTMVADLNLGRFTNSALYYTGLIDEARIHSGLDSSNWVWASYMTVASNSVFSTYSSVTSTAPPNVTLTIQYLNGAVVLTWPQGTLQSANQATGPYSNMPTATSPYTNVITGTQKFYRVKVQ
jgi:hypothetical protein